MMQEMQTAALSTGGNHYEREDFIIIISPYKENALF
jgi:hypothetical protein